MRRREFLQAGVVAGATVAGITKAQSSPGNFSFTIIHTNDTHARLDPTLLTLGGQQNRPLGGFARVINFFDRMRATERNPLFLHAGDVFQGTLFFNQYRGLADRYFMHRMGIRAMTLGNHEFDLGPDALANFLNGARFPVVTANIDVSREPKLAGKIPPYTVVSVGGQRVGVIGLITPDTDVLANPGPNVRFLDPVKSTQDSVNALLARGVKNIVVLSHLGYTVDLELAKKVVGAQVIVGGHSHTLLGRFQFQELVPGGAYPTVVKNPENKDVLVVQAWEWAKVVGRLRLTFNPNGELVSYEGTPLLMGADIPEERFAKEAIATYALPIAALRAQVVGRTSVVLNGERADVRRRETNLSNLIADGLLWKTRSLNTVIAIQNGGGVRATIPQGNITLGQVYEVLPFGNTLFVLDMTGAEVRAALENGVSQWEQSAGRFPSGVAGLRFTFDLARPVGQRVTDVQVAAQGGFAPINPTATYRVVTNNFVAGGGDGFTSMRDAKGFRVDTGFTDAESFVEYIRSLPEVAPAVQGRITILNEPRAGYFGPTYTGFRDKVGV